MADDTVLETAIATNAPGHAAKHNTVNTQVNYLTEQWAGRATDPTLLSSIGAKLGGQRMLLMGDSRVALCTPPEGVTSGSGTYVYDDRSWWVWAQIALGQRFDYVDNTAVGGSLTADHIDDQLADVVASSATHVLHWGFLNDMGASSSPNPVTTINNLTTIYDAVRGQAKTLIVTTDYLQPAQTDPDQIAACAKVNAFVRHYARTNTNVILWDAAALLTDPDDDGYIRADLTIDAVHPNKHASMILGQSLAQILANTTQPLSPLTVTPNDPYNILTNGLFIGGSVPTDWGKSNGAGGAVPGTVTRLDRTDGGPGYLWQAELVATGADTGKVNLNTGVDASALVGHVVIPRVYFETGALGGALDWSNISYFRMWASTDVAPGASYALYPSTDTDPVNAAEFPRSGVMQGPPITLGVGTTNARFFVELATVGAGAGGGTIRIGQAELHDLTACGY